VSSSGVDASSDAETLGFDEDDVFQPRADLSIGPFDFMGSYHDATYAGSGTAEAELDLGGVVIPAGDAVDSELDTTYFALVGTFDFLPTDTLDLGIGLGASSIDFDAMITSQTTGDSVRSSEAFVVPVVALRGEVELWGLALNAHVHGLDGSFSGIEGSLVDYDASLSWRFLDGVGLFAALVAGYRELRVDVEYEEDGSDIEADLAIGGPYLGLTVGL
jgi:hypothetical protein